MPKSRVRESEDRKLLIDVKGGGFLLNGLKRSVANGRSRIYTSNTGR